MKNYAIGILALVFACSGIAGEISIKKEKVGLFNGIVIENDLFKTVIIPELARFPYSYVNKKTGHEFFRFITPITIPQAGFKMYGGITDSLPWVGGINGPKKFQDKGYLYCYPWKTKITSSPEKVSFHGTNWFWYIDPVSGKPCKIAFEKTVTAYRGSARLDMTQKITNIDKKTVKFTFSQHGRLAINENDDGDYMYAPGTKAYVYYVTNEEYYEEKGIKPETWHKWPMREVTEFQPVGWWGKKLYRWFGIGEVRYGIFCFVPANWAVAGDENNLESLWFISSPIKYRSKKLVPQMGLLNRSSDYLIELCVTPSIVAAAKEWNDNSKALPLKPGESCEYTMSLVARNGVSKDDLAGVGKVTADITELTPVKLVMENGKMKLSGRLASSATGELLVVSGRKTVAKMKLVPGVTDLKSFPAFTASKGKLNIKFKTSHDTQDLGL